MNIWSFFLFIYLDNILDESNVRKTRGQVSGHTKKSKGTKKDRIHQKIIQNIIIRGPS